MTYDTLRMILNKYTHFTCEIQREQVIKAMIEAVNRRDEELRQEGFKYDTQTTDTTAI